MDLLRALTGGTHTPDAYERVGQLIMEFSAAGPFRHLGGLVGGVKPLYSATFGWVMAATVKCVRAEVQDVSADTLQVKVQLEAEEGTCEPFLYGLLGTMKAMPRTLGHLDATVEAEISDLGGIYKVRLPPVTSLWSRTQRAWAAMTDREGHDHAVVELRDTVTALLGDVRAANAKLRESEARWRTLAEGIPGAVFVAGGPGEVDGPFGVSPPKPEMATQILAAFRDQEGEIEAGNQATFQVVGGDEENTWAWSCKASRLPDSDRTVIVALDDTAAHRTRRELGLQLARSLQSQKMEALGRLAGGGAHDFNNLLAAVQGHADLLEVRWGHDAAVVAHVDGIASAVEDASALTRQLLAYGRARPNGIDQFDLGEAVRSHESMYARLIGDHIALATELSTEALFVRADPGQLQQVLMNLIVNSRYAMPSGGQITIRTALSHVDGTEWVELTVHDEGVGMDEAVRDRAMEPFFTTKGVGRGTGLGLSTVYWIVEQNGGRVHIVTREGAGTTVCVALPRVSRPLSSSEPSPSPEAEESEPATILLVEDDDRVREMVQSMLESQRYRVIACSHAAEARRSLAALAQAPDLLLTDITMPGENGLSLANGLAAQHPRLGILLMSGFTAETPELDAAHRHRGAFLAKPFKLRSLRESIREALEKRPSLV